MLSTSFSTEMDQTAKPRSPLFLCLSRSFPLLWHPTHSFSLNVQLHYASQYSITCFNVLCVVELVKQLEAPSKTLLRERHTASHRHTITAEPLSFPYAGLLLPICPILKKTFILYTVLPHLSTISLLEIREVTGHFFFEGRHSCLF